MQHVLKLRLYGIKFDFYTRGVMNIRNAAIFTIGNEVICGDIANTNGSWIARQLATLGIEVHLLITLRDDVDVIAEFLSQYAKQYEIVFITGGLGGTPDDITREAVAAAFGVKQHVVPDLAEQLRLRFEPHGLGSYAANWANLPDGADPLENPLGGAPGFVLQNVYVMPGLPAEMEAMFELIKSRFRGTPIGEWRRIYQTGEGQIVDVLEYVTRVYKDVSVGSYPRFSAKGPTVEIVLKSSNSSALDQACSWLTAELDRRLGLDC